jgi:hypothetical protein
MRAEVRAVGEAENVSMTLFYQGTGLELPPGILTDYGGSTAGFDVVTKRNLEWLCRSHKIHFKIWKTFTFNPCFNISTAEAYSDRIVALIAANDDLNANIANGYSGSDKFLSLPRKSAVIPPSDQRIQNYPWLRRSLSAWKLGVGHNRVTLKYIITAQRPLFGTRELARDSFFVYHTAGGDRKTFRVQAIDKEIHPCGNTPEPEGYLIEPHMYGSSLTIRKETAQ